jgi:hypothetical protein
LSGRIDRARPRPPSQPLGVSKSAATYLRHAGVSEAPTVPTGGSSH